MTDMTTTQDPQTGTYTARRAMIDSQLRTSGVNEEYVLARMLAVPREDFLPADKASVAYIDRAVMLGEGGHLAAPLFYGKLLMEAAPAPDDRVLVVEALQVELAMEAPDHAAGLGHVVAPGGQWPARAAHRRLPVDVDQFARHGVAGKIVSRNDGQIGLQG